VKWFLLNSTGFRVGKCTISKLSAILFYASKIAHIFNKSNRQLLQRLENAFIFSIMKAVVGLR
jgi:hypothetical protein